MLPNNTARVRLDTLRIASVTLEGWHEAAGRIPDVGDTVQCVEGEAEVVRILGKVSDGSRLLELKLPDRPKASFFAASSNVLMAGAPAED